ncbi:MAG: ABC transporter substrate-binding protein [Bacteroides sp.]|nr:ABC transporter substrate-binding protein [Bacteroides sp.]
MKKLIRLFYSLLLLCIGCTHSGTEKQEFTHKLKIGYTPDPAIFPFYIADTLEIYENMTLDVSFLSYGSQQECIEAFKAGDLDGAVMEVPEALQLAAAGLGSNIILRNSSASYFIATSASEITDPKSDLEGKSVAYSRQPLPDYILDHLLADNRSAAGKTNRPVIGNEFVRFQMLRNGLLDATLLGYAEAAEALQEGNHLVTTVTEKEIPMRITLVRSDSLQKKRPEIAALVKGYEDGVSAIRDFPEDTKADFLLASGIAADDPDMLLPSYEPPSPVKKEQLRKMIGWLKEKAYLSAEFNDKAMTDTLIKTY